MILNIVANYSNVSNINLSNTILAELNQNNFNYLCGIIANSNLQTINLESCDLNKLSLLQAEQLIFALNSSRFCLEKLNLKYNNLANLNSGLFIKLCDFIAGCHKLKQLKINTGNQLHLLTNEQQSRFVEHLPKNINLSTAEKRPAILVTFKNQAAPNILRPKSCGSIDSLDSIESDSQASIQFNNRNRISISV
jgi:hypothetical protein